MDPHLQHSLSELLNAYRYASVSIHRYHWEVRGATANQDHVLLGTVYQLLDTFVDGVGERIVGLGGVTPSVATQGNFIATLAKENGEIDSMYLAYRLTELIAGKTNAVTTATSDEGTKNLLAGYADQLEQQVFFLRQRAMA